MRVRPSTIAIVTAAVFATAGCTSGATEPSTSTSPTTAASSTTSPSPSTSPTTEAQHAAANATELVHEYYRTTDAVATDPSNLEPLTSVATSAELLRLQNTFTQWADDGWHKTGAITVVELTTQSVSLEDPDPTVQIDVCYDVTGVDVVDGSGESQVATNRPDRTWERLWVSNPNYGDDRESGWLVADRKTLERKSCAAR